MYEYQFKYSTCPRYAFSPLIDAADDDEDDEEEQFVNDAYGKEASIILLLMF